MKNDLNKTIAVKQCRLLQGFLQADLYAIQNLKRYKLSLFLIEI